MSTFLEKSQIFRFHCLPVYYLFKIYLFHGLMVPPTTSWSMCFPQGLFFSEKNTPLEFWSMYLGIFVDFIKKMASFTEKCVKFTKLFSKLAFLYLLPESAEPTEPAEPAESPEVVSASAAQTLPSTHCAGGQDDGRV